MTTISQRRIYAIILSVLLIACNSQPPKQTQEEVTTISESNELKKAKAKRAKENKAYKYSNRIDSLLNLKMFEEANVTIDSALLEIDSTNTWYHLITNARKELYIMQLHGYDRVKIGIAPHIISMKDDKYGICTEDGKELYPPIYDDFTPVFEPYTLLERNGKAGLIDTLNRVVIPMESSIISHTLFGNIAEVEQNGKSGFFSLPKGEFVMDIAYKIHFIGQTPYPYFLVVEKNNKQGVFHALEEKLVIPCKYDSIQGFNLDGVSFAIKQGKNILIDTLGNEKMGI